MAKNFIADKETLDRVYSLLAPGEPGSETMADKLDSCKELLGSINGAVSPAEPGGETMGSKLDSCRETLGNVYNLLSAGEQDSDEVFGFIEHNSILAAGSRISYIGANKDFRPVTVMSDTGCSLGGWADFPVILENKPWMVHSDGTKDYRLREDDYSYKEDGVTASDVANANYDGGAFSWLKKIYKQEYMVGMDRVVKFSFKKKEGFHANGFIDDSGNELEGVWLPMFYGSIVGSKMRSISGNQPDHDKTTDAQKAAIDAFSTRAKFLGGPIVETLTDLLIMWAKTTDIEAAYGKGNDSGYNSAASPTYGVKANAVVGGGQFFGTSDGKSLNKILHSIVLGSWQQWMRDPYTLCVNGKVKVSKNYKYDLTGATYEDAGISYPATVSEQYPHMYKTVPGFGALPTAPYKGSSTTGGCDGFWVNVGITAVAIRFGDCNGGSFCGSRALNLYNAASPAGWNVGCAVLLLPPVGAAA